MESVGIAFSIFGVTVSYIVGCQLMEQWNMYIERKKLKELLAGYDQYDMDILLECDDMEDVYEGFSLMHSPGVDPIENEKVWLIVNYEDNIKD